MTCPGFVSVRFRNRAVGVADGMQAACPRSSAQEDAAGKGCPCSQGGQRASTSDLILSAPSMRVRRSTAFASFLIAAVAGCAKDPALTVAPGVDADGTIASGDEAGFIDVPAQPGGSTHSGRMFYVFEPADSEPENKPLAIFMAGGPGYPASLELLPYGIARATLPSFGAAPTANPASWTSFANLLFVDERQSGFSYETDDGAPDAVACTYSPTGDSADFVRVLLAFLDSHPAIRAAPVILVGQSYGGERATFMLDLLLRYSTEAAPTLRATIQAHYDAVFPAAAGTVIAPALATTQFGHVVLLQPFILGGLQYAVQDALAPADPYIGAVPAGNDPYDVRQPAGWSQEIDDAPAAVLADFGEATTLFGVDPRTIPALRPPARTNAFRASASDPTQAQTNAQWTSTLGPLAAGDVYLAAPGTACPYGQALFTGAGSLPAFLANLEDGVRTFITDARFDASIYAPAIPAALTQVATVAVDDSPRAGVERPGWFTVTFAPDGGVAAAVQVRFPPYVDSGHFVALAEPQALHDDVVTWLSTAP
jgi:hypothetical protein